MARVVVLGGAGFLGSHLCDALLRRGDEVVAVDNFCTGSKDNVKHLASTNSFSLIDADICDVIPVSGKVDLIFNFASPASPKQYLKMPLETLRVGSVGTENAIKLALQNSARLIMASTSEVYGDPLENPQSETYFGNVNPFGLRSCYDEAKRFSEALLMAHHRTSKLNLGIVRIFNTYGPRLDPDDGRVVSTIIMQAIVNHDVTIHGDGSQTRSFCYVDDLIRGIIALADSSEVGPINLGNNIEITVSKLAEMVLKLCGSKSKVVFTQAMEDDPQQRCPDLAQAKDKLGWEPQVPVEDGLKKTIEWFKQNHN
ncbi:MAG: SDR family oxidoreductase [Ilumatobacteraceae bacterium]|nr:SDR family oxidoreductase [Ilumatobacteraceae bacterium]